MGKLKNEKDKIVGKAKQLMAEVDGDDNLAQKGKVQEGESYIAEEADERKAIRRRSHHYL